MNKQTTQIGTLTFENPTRIRLESSFAAWFDEIEQPAGTVAVFGVVGKNGEVEDASLVYAVEGPVTASNWTSHFGGVAYGSKVNENLGQMIKRTLNFGYAHAIAHRLVEGLPTTFALLPGFVAMPVDFGYTHPTGKRIECRTYKIQQVLPEGTPMICRREHCERIAVTADTLDTVALCAECIEADRKWHEQRPVPR